MKFGGTSVATPEGRSAIARRVQATLELDRAPVVVVSAMGRAGAPYATDTLLGLVADLPSDPHERDLLASVGEVVSAIVVAHELRAAGISARAFTGTEAGIWTDAEPGSATITEVLTGPLLDAVGEGVVPVVCGFQGCDEEGRVTTLGRGGSDTTACALGVALTADEVEIYTDVDGVMTADPRACDGAEVLEVIRADELFQMARAGSRVVHTPAAELALSSGLSVRVRNTYSEHPGTRVADIASYRPAEVATAVSHADGIARVRVALGAEEGTQQNMDAQTRVYRAMAEEGVSLDMFTPGGDSLMFTVPEASLATVSRVLERLGMSSTVKRDLAKVTLVGAGMHGVPGVMARLSAYLDEAGVPVLQAADSHTTISVLVPAADARAAVNALHAGFGLAPDPRETGSDATESSRERFGTRTAAYRASSAHAGGEDLELLVSLVSPAPGEAALDIATGAGHTAVALARAGAQVTASDVTPEMLDEARDNFAEAGLSAQFALADACDLPFADGSFGVVTARMAPHHFENPERFIREVARVLASGGRFGLEDQIAPEDPVAASVTNEFERLRDPSHNRQLARTEWISLAQRAGLVVEYAEVLSKRIDFEWWTSIQNVSEKTRDDLSALLGEGPEAARDWYAPEFRETGRIESFEIPHLIMLARKPQ